MTTLYWRNPMGQKIIFFDIDGTLLSDMTHLVPESAILALKKAQQNGHLLFINTGRCISNIPPEIQDMNFDGYVCGCGTYINYRGNILLSNSFESNAAKELIATVKECKIDIILEGKEGNYFDTDENITHNVVKMIKQDNIKSKSCEIKSFFDDTIHFDKFVIWINPDSDYPKFYDKYNDSFDFIQRADDFYEVVPVGYSKASGIQYLLDYLQIDYDDTYALGDSMNDLSMLEYVKYSIAMGNSDSKLFDLVSYVTKDIEEDGVYHALQHFGLI